MITGPYISTLNKDVPRGRTWLAPILRRNHQWLSLCKRALGGRDTDPGAQKLVIAGIVSGAISIMILVGLVVYMVLRYRRQRQHPRPRQSRTSVPATSQIRNGYSRARAESGATDGSRSKGIRIAPDEEPKRSYFKSWSKSTKTAYLSLPTGLNASHHQLVLESSDAVYRYDPEAAASLPKQKRKKPSRSPLALLAPTPKVDVPTRPPFAEVTNTFRLPTRRPPDPPRAPIRTIRPRAELRMAQPSLDARTHLLRTKGGILGGAGLGSFVPPPPPSWASFWPTESGFTGHEGEPSIRDEEFGDESEEEWRSDEEHVKEKLREREEAETEEKNEGVVILLERKVSGRTDDYLNDNGEEQYALDTRPADQVYGSFRLTPRELQGHGRTSLEVDPIAEGGSFTTGASPLPSARLEVQSPHLDLGDSGESDVDELTHLADGPTDLRRGATGRFTIAFGESSHSRSLSGKGSGSKSDHVTRSSTGRTRSSGRRSHSNRTGTDRSDSNLSRPTPGHSRNSSGAALVRSNTGVTRSNTGITRSSTIRTDYTDSSNGSSGQIMSIITGRLATPLLRSVESLRRVIGTYTEPPEAEESSPVTTGSSPGLENPPPPPYSSPVRRLPPIPSAPPIPPVPPIPQRYLNQAPDDRPIISEHMSVRTAAEHGVLRSMSLGLPDGRALPSRPNNLPHALVPRSVSMRTTRPIRPLPVPPLPTASREVVSSESRS